MQIGEPMESRYVKSAALFFIAIFILFATIDDQKLLGGLIALLAVIWVVYDWPKDRDDQ